LLAAPPVLLSQSAAGTSLSGSFTTQQGDAPYFRLVRLEHGSHNGTIVASEGIIGIIRQSNDNGNS
jgi:hypothetical protein